MQEPIKIKFQLTREDYVTSLRLFNAKMPLAWVAYLIVGVLLTYFALTLSLRIQSLHLLSPWRSR